MRDRRLREAREIGAWLLSAALLGAVSVPLHAGGIPVEAQHWKRTLIREVRAEHGLDGPAALHAGLIHQESGWRSSAESSVGAQGLAQIMPATAEHIEQISPRIDALNPRNPRQAIRAAAIYTAWIHGYVTPAEDPWAMTLSGYNGGIGWVKRDRELAAEHGADPGRWWGNVAEYTARSDAARRENRHYVRRIITELQPRYLRNGWPGPAVERR